MEMAKAEGWIDKAGSKWKTMPELMRRYRAASFFTKQFAPEVSMGLQTIEEIIDITKHQESSPKPTQEEIELDRQKQMIEDCKTLEELMDLQTKYPDWDSSLYTDKKQKLIQVAK